LSLLERRANVHTFEDVMHVDPTTSFLLSALPLGFGAMLAAAATLMLWTGRAPNDHRHIARRADAGVDSARLFWSIVMATAAAAAAVLYAGIAQIMAG
jgi:hypothetical protein